MRPLDHVKLWAVMLQEIEIDRREFSQRVAQVADHRNSLQKNFGEYDGGSDVDIDSTAIEIANQ